MQVSFVCSHSPFASKLAIEGLDMALAFAAFEQDVSLVFVDDGVYQLLPQQSDAIGQKNLAKRLQAAELYDINKLYVCRHSLATRNITATELADINGLNVVDDITGILANSQSVMSF